MKFKLVFFVLSFSAITLQTCKPDSAIKVGPTISLNASFLSILNNFIGRLDPLDSASVFVIVKNIDANSAKCYIVAKKPLRTDFEIIGTPLTVVKIKDADVYFFSGLEKIMGHDTIFWKKHPEVYDDRKKQVSGIYETPIINKEAYFYDNEIWQKDEKFDDMIFIGNPSDTLFFGQSK
jgi:hypothetical protein